MDRDNWPTRLAILLLAFVGWLTVMDVAWGTDKEKPE